MICFREDAPDDEEWEDIDAAVEPDREVEKEGEDLHWLRGDVNDELEN